MRDIRPGSTLRAGTKTAVAPRCPHSCRSSEDGIYVASRRPSNDASTCNTNWPTSTTSTPLGPLSRGPSTAQLFRQVTASLCGIEDRSTARAGERVRAEPVAPELPATIHDPGTITS